MEKILVVDDNEVLRETLVIYLRSKDYECFEAGNGKEALMMLQKDSYDIVITDIEMPEMNGIELLKKASHIYPMTMFIIITGFGSMETAVEALREGAYDYITKPLNFDDIFLKIEKLLSHKRLMMENQNLRMELNRQYNFHNIVGESEAMKKVFEQIQKVSMSDSNVLISGRSGTGKELVARAIHFNSKRSLMRFVPINCAAIPENLFESELFGYLKGAFTGAFKNKKGFFQAADKGTLFLDEIVEIPIHIQVKLLRALEEKEIIPVGSTNPIKVNARIIGATNRVIEDEVEKGKFREDLYYRLNIVQIRLPSLSERKEDIPVLIKHFINKYNKEMNKKVLRVDNEVMNILLNHRWQGEVRELENIIERAMIFCEDDIITVNELPINMLKRKKHKDFDFPKELKKALNLFEKNHILKILEKNNYHRKKTAIELGIGESSLYRKLNNYEINLN